MTALGIHLTLSVSLACLMLIGVGCDKQRNAATGVLLLWAVIQILTALLIRFA